MPPQPKRPVSVSIAQMILGIHGVHCAMIFSMKKCLRYLSAICIVASAGFGQIHPAPPGYSKFISVLGGMSPGEGKSDLLQLIAGTNIDATEAGGGVEDWTEIEGRIFLTRRWMVEIGEIRNGYSTFDLEKGLADEMQRQLEADGFKLTPKVFKLHFVRYQRGRTVGTVEVRSFFLGRGNPPFRMEFIFSESYIRTSKSRSKS